MVRRMLALLLVTLSLTGCLTNKTTTYTYDYDEFDGKVLVEEEQTEEVSIGGTLLAVGAITLVVLGAMGDIQ